MRHWTPILVAAIAVLLLPELAHACAVCGAADDNANTYLGSTLFLSLLPLSMLFGGAYSLRYASSHPELFD